MARLEGKGGRVSNAAQGEVRRFTQRGATRLGLVALAAGLLGVNWLGWVRYGAAAGGEVQAAGGTTSSADPTGGSEAAPAAAAASLGSPRRQPLGLLHALPSEGVGRASMLTVVFDGPVVALLPGQGIADLPALTEVPFSAFERMPSGAYEPLDLPGRWSWGGADRLDFTLATPLGAGRSVRFEPTAALEGLAGRPAAKGLRPEWTSEQLAVRAVRLRSCDREAFTVEVDFNARVDALSLAAALEAADSAARAAAKAASTEVSPIRRPRRADLQPPAPAPQAGALLIDAAVLSTGSELTHTMRYKRTGDASRVRLHFPASVLPARGALGLGTPHEHHLDLPASFDVIGHWIEHARHADQAVVRIRFDRPLAVGQEEPPVKVTPEVTPLTARFSGQQLVLDGAFEARGRYTIEIGGSLLAVDGQTLGRKRTVVCEIPPRQPNLELDHNRGILAPGGGLMLPLTATNVRSVLVTATKVLPGNLVPHLRGEQSEYTSREVLSEVFPLTVSPDRPERRALDLRALFGDAAGGVRGVYSLELRSTEDYWTRTFAVIRITDLVVTLKEDRGAVHAWVQSLANGAPVGGAAVSALTVTDQLVASGVTDDAGYVALEVPRGDRDSRVFVVTAERDGDMAYARLDGSAWSIPAELAEGRTAPELADVYVYTERRMYRPGDMVHLTGIARTPEGQRYSGQIKVRTLRPDGLELARQEVSTELVQGLFHLDIPTPLDARTGMYTVEVEVPDARGHARCVGRTRFEVEAFLAARLTLTAEPEVTAAATDRMLAPLNAAESLPSRHVQVKSLSSTSVAGYPVRIAARWTPVAFESASHPELYFGTLGPNRDVVRAEWAGALDAAGRAEVAPPGADTLPPGRWAGRLEWTVTEPGGRSVSTVETLTVERPATHLGLGLEGLRRSGSYNIVAVAPDFAGPLAVQWLTVDAAGNASVAPALAYELARVEREPELVDMGGSFAWRASERIEVLATGTLARGEGASEGRVEVPAQLLGASLLRLTVRAPESQPVSLDFYVHRGAAESFVRPLEGLDSVELSTLGGATRPGEVIEVDVRAPFDGSLLVTLEDTRLRAQRRVDLIGGSARIAFTVPRDVRGDVFVSAQVTRPLERQTAWRPHRAHGWLRVKTLHGDQCLSATLTAPERVHPGSRANVEVAVGGLAPDHAALVHLFAVDEGIRITGGDRLPDPVGHFFAPRRHSTRTTDGWFDLVPDTELPPEVRLIGGDGDLGADRARQRAPEEVRKTPGIVWQHAVALDRDGRQSFELEVPDFVGTLTWIAVVVDGDRYGACNLEGGGYMVELSISDHSGVDTMSYSCLNPIRVNFDFCSTMNQLNDYVRTSTNFIFPNPNSGQFHVSFGPDTQFICIYDMIGRKVPFSASDNNVQIVNPSGGLFVAEIAHKNYVFRQRFMVIP